MKRFLIIAMLLATAFSGFSQGDSTIDNVPARALRKALSTADSLDAMKKERAEWQRQQALYETILKKDQEIFTRFDSTLSVVDQMLDRLSQQSELERKRHENMETINRSLADIIKKKNWTIIKITGGAAIAIGGLTYLLLRH